MKHLLLLSACALAACVFEAPVVSAVTLQMPEVVECANPPAEILSEAWQSGAEDPTVLDVDEDGATAGELVVTSGLERRIVVDWYIEQGEQRVLLAQARTQIDLTKPDADEIDLAFGADDITVTDCVDVTDDLAREGFPLISVGGEVVPVCDLDASCGGEREDVEIGCSNLGDICAGEDPVEDEAGLGG